jgi:hypothetical protein
VWRHHLLSEQIDQQYGRVALWAVATQADGSAKEVAVRAAALADEAFTTTRAFVDRLSLHDATALEFETKPLQIWQARLTPQAERTLLMGTRAIACTP